MSAWLTLLYTLTETHVGGSGASGATDLPIARESTTDLPFVPDTALKGVARDVAEEHMDRGVVDRLFGHGPNDAADTANASDSRAGQLSVAQGTMLLYPLRSLQRPYLYATSALLLDRLVRLTNAFELGLTNANAWAALLKDADHVRVASKRLHGAPLVMEGMAFGAGEVKHEPAATELAKAVAGWFTGASRTPTAQRVEDDLVVLPDVDMLHLVRTATPVRARIRLNERKTTTGDQGNLWYEEMLPSDCLLWSIFGLPSRTKGDDRTAAVGDLEKLIPKLDCVQIGGGETTGHGRCWWWDAAAPRRG